MGGLDSCGNGQELLRVSSDGGFKSSMLTMGSIHSNFYVDIYRILVHRSKSDPLNALTNMAQNDRLTLH